MSILSTLLSAISGGVGQVAIATLPAPPVGQRQRINYIEIIAYSTANRTGNATPITVNTTNLNGLVWYFSTWGAIGVVERVIYQPKNSIDASNQNTPVTITCPATPSVRWIINVCYRNEEI